MKIKIINRLEEVTKKMENSSHFPSLLGHFSKGEMVLVQAILLALMLFAADLRAQTTLSGDHIVTGNLDVGNSGNKSNLKVTGQTGGAALPGLKVTGDGGVLFEGTFGTGQIPATGAGTRFMWYPKKAALRVGRVTGEQWDDAYIGENSVALGEDLYATGNFSVAMGGSANGDYSIAMSGGYAGNDHSTSMSGGNALGDYSVAMSSGLTMGAYSTAMSGGGAYKDYSTGLSGGRALGSYSVAAGEGIYATAAHSVVIGRYNIDEGDPESWVSTDPLFVVGNGNSTVPKNAFSILKNGKVSVFGSSPTTPAIVLDPTTTPPQITVGNNTVALTNSSGRLLVPYSSGGSLELQNTDDSSRGGALTTVGSSGNGTFGMSSTGSGYALTFGIDSVEKMRIATSGNVGIGTTSPSAKLSINGTTSANLLFDVVSPDGANNTEYIAKISNLDVSNGQSNGLLIQAGNDANDAGFKVVSRSGAATHLFVRGDGNVGIGTTAPTAKFEVNGDMKVAGRIRVEPQGDLSMGDFTDEP